MIKSAADLPKRERELRNFPHERSSYHVCDQIDELRGSLDRRNKLLDAIRKAYHRDVLVVKECLIDARRQGLIENFDETNPFQSFSSLDSLPSIDLRETFRLFAPEGCELRLRPCWTCGGQMEVIHRESARIANFKRSMQILEEREKTLSMKLVEAKVNAQEDRDRLVDFMAKRQDEQDILTEQILSLKHQVADRNELDTEVRLLKSDKRNLETTMESQKPTLLDHGRLVVEEKKVRAESKQWEEKFYEQVQRNRQLESVKDSLTQQLSLLGHQNEQLYQNLMAANDQFRKADDQCSTLTQDLVKSQAATKEIGACLHKAEHAIGEQEAEFHQQKHQLKCQISNLESRCSDSETTIRDLEDKSKKNAEEAAYYSKSIQAMLEGARSRGSIAFVPQNWDGALAKTDELVRETEHLRQKTSVLFNLLLSCTRSTYEKCLVQENLLVKNGSELHTNDQKLKISHEPINDKVRAMLEHLDNKDKSDVIDWSSILLDETDQRHIIGNLQNRLQMGYFSLDKAFQKIHKSYAIEMRKYQDEHQKQLEDRRLRIWDLEKMLHSSISSNRKYEDKMLKMQEKYCTLEQNIDSLRCILRKMRRECVTNDDIMSMLKDDHGKMITNVNRLVTELNASKEVIRTQQVDIAEKEDDVSNRDNALAQLESVLEKITHKYAESIKETYGVATQAAPMVADAASHADFLPSLPDNKQSDDSLLRGRIINVDVDNWPSINLSYNPNNFVGAVKPGLQYRRALDKL